MQEDIQEKLISNSAIYPPYDAIDSPSDEQLSNDCLTRLRNFSTIPRKLPCIIEPLIFIFRLLQSAYLLWIQEYIKHNYDSKLRYEKDTIHVFAAVNETGCDLNIMNTTSYSSSSEELVHKYTSLWLGTMRPVSSIPALIATLLILPMTDVKGRRLGLLLPTVGGLLLTAVCLMVAHFQLNINYILIGTAMDGIFGRERLFLGSSFAFLADVVPGEKRSARFTLLNSLLFLGAGLGSMVMGNLISFTGYIIPLYFLLAGFLTSLIFSIVIPEPLQLPRKDKVKKLALSQILSGYKLYCTKHESNRVRPQFYPLLLLTVYGLLAWTKSGNVDVNMLYVLGSPFCLSPALLGYLRMTKFMARAVYLGGIGLWLKHSLSESALSITSSVLGIAAILIQSFAVNLYMLFACK